MSYADQKLVHDVILAEAQGNYRVAFEMACARLSTAYHGVSAGYMRWGANGEGVIVADPPPVDDGEWIRTGRTND